MGQMFESCKQHCDYCNREENKESPKVETEPSQPDSVESSENSDNDEENVEIKNRGSTCIPSDQIKFNDISKFKTNLNSLVMDRKVSPWLYYTEIKLLGAGTYGRVKLATRKDDPTIKRAIKEIPKECLKEGSDCGNLLDEVNILKKLDHPYIMKIYECFIDEDFIYIVSDFCDQGDLLGKLEKLGHMNQVVVKMYMEKLLNAVAYLHKQNVLHGDIKLENILLFTASNKKTKRFTLINQDISSNLLLQQALNKNDLKQNKSKQFITDMSKYELKLIDFGCSKYFVNDKKKKKIKTLKGIIGTSIYCSPEVIDDSYDEKCDEWACGVVMYLLLCGEPPFTGDTEEEIFAAIKKGKIDFDNKCFRGVSPNCIDLIKKLLEPNKHSRIGAAEALRHPFFTEDFNIKKAMKVDTDLDILKKVDEILDQKPLTSKFHQVILTFLCGNYISIDEEAKLRKVFRYLDKNGNTTINFNDLKEGLQGINLYYPESTISEILNKIDINHCSLVHYQEFLCAFCDKTLIYKEENLKSVFKEISEEEFNNEKNCGDNKDNNENKKEEQSQLINSEKIKNFIFHDIDIPKETLIDYLNQFGMGIDDTMNFEEFKEIIFQNKRLDEVKKEADEILLKIAEAFIAELLEEFKITKTHHKKDKNKNKEKNKDKEDNNNSNISISGNKRNFGFAGLKKNLNYIPKIIEENEEEEEKKI